MSYRNLNELKASIRKNWGKVKCADLVNASKAFRGRVESVLKSNGGHIE